MISFAGLTGGSIRSIVRALIPGFIKLGWSRNYALTYLKKFGKVYRRKAFLRDWSQILGVEQKRDPLKYVRNDCFPTPDVITPTKDKLKQRFKFVYKVQGYDSDTGQVHDYPVAFGSAHLHHMKTLDEMARVLATSVKCGEKLVLTKMERDCILQQTITEAPGVIDRFVYEV